MQNRDILNVCQYICKPETGGRAPPQILITVPLREPYKTYRVQNPVTGYSASEPAGSEALYPGLQAAFFRYLLPVNASKPNIIVMSLTFGVHSLRNSPKAGDCVSRCSPAGSSVSTNATY